MIINSKKQYELAKELLVTYNESRRNKKPMSIAIINASHDSANLRYISRKEKILNENGIQCDIIYVDEEVSTDFLINRIREIKDNYTGILVQSPIFDHLDFDKIVNSIPPSKDVDCLGFYNQGAIYAKTFDMLPCTAFGVETILTENTDISEKNIVIIGRSKIVAGPLATRLTNMNATVSVIHSKTPIDTQFYLLRNADIIISCVGKDMTDILNPTICERAEMVIGVGFRYEKVNGKLKQLQDFDKDVWPDDVLVTDNVNATGLATLSRLLYNTVMCDIRQEEGE